MKIAFATRDHIHVNTHFGSTKKIDVYEVNTEGYTFLNTLTFDGNLNEDGNEDKLLPKIEALYNCTIVYVATIGSSAAARLIKQKITPVKAQSEEQEIVDVLNRLVETLKGNPPPWLRKALQQSTPLNELEEEEEVAV